MFKLIIKYSSWDSPQLKGWELAIANLTAMDVTKETKNLSTMDQELEPVYPWNCRVEHLYTALNDLTIIITFESTEDWEECRSHPDFEDAFNFESLDFLDHLDVCFCEVTNNLRTGSRIL